MKVIDEPSEPGFFHQRDKDSKYTHKRLTVPVLYKGRSARIPPLIFKLKYTRLTTKRSAFRFLRIGIIMQSIHST